MTTVKSTPAKTSDQIRDEVSRAYTAAIGRAAGSGQGCCGGGCGTGTATPTGAPTAVGVAALTAGYGDELTNVPADVAGSSFGCGNPLAFAGVRPGDTVLDLGSGAGLDLLIAAEKVGPEGRVIGVDMTDAMIEAARRNVERAGAAQVEIRKGLIEELPVADGTVDWVISNCVINLSADKKLVFHEIHRVLRPGGSFSISDIVAEELPEWLRQEAAAHSACIGGAISETEYRAGLEATGLVDVEVTDRLVYDAAQLRGMVASDLEDLGVTSELLERGVEEVAGKVWSVKLTGRKPAVS